ncbi:MAG: aminotransferase class V-fold PLP-dependent enzyme [bacterium]
MKHIKNKIQTKKLFSKEIIDFQIKSKRLGLTKYVNLDNAATTPPFLSVEKAVKDFFVSYGSVHRGAGVKSKISTSLYEESRQVIKDFVGAPKDSYVLFTGNTTGGINTLAYFFSFLTGKVAVSSIEHSSSWLPWLKTEGMKEIGSKRVELNKLKNLNQKIQSKGNKQVLFYEIDENFEFDLTEIESLLKNNKIKALVLTACSNVTGYCPDIKTVGELVHKYGAYFIVDACQYIQHHKIDMKEMNIDFLVASGHKFYAPYGGGFLVGQKDFFDKFLPYQIGGGNLPYISEQGEMLLQNKEQAHDSGTPNAVGAVAVMQAIKTLKQIGYKQINNHEQVITKKVFDYLKNNPKIKLLVSEKHLNTVIPFVVLFQDSREVAERLNYEFGIGVRAGSFCTYRLLRRLLNIKNDKQIIEEVKKGNTKAVPAIIRASFGLCNEEKDADRFIQAIKKITE